MGQSVGQLSNSNSVRNEAIIERLLGNGSGTGRSGILCLCRIRMHYVVFYILLMLKMKVQRHDALVWGPPGWIGHQFLSYQGVKDLFFDKYYFQMSSRFYSEILFSPGFKRKNVHSCTVINNYPFSIQFH